MIKKDPEFWLRIAVVVFLTALVVIAPSILFPFGLSLILALLLHPLAETIQKTVEKLGWKRMPFDLSIILSFIVFLIVLSGVIIYIFVPFVNEFRQFIANIPSMVQDLQNTLPRLERFYSIDVMPPEIRRVAENLMAQIGNYTVRLAQFSLSAIFSFASTMIELIVVPFITFYMIKKGSVFCDVFISLFPERYHNHLYNLFTEIHFVLSAYVRGQLMLSTLMAAVIFLGMLFFNIPYPLVIALLAGVVEMIPVMGPIIGAVPPVLLALVQSTGLAVQVIVFYVFVQQLDGHLVMPKLMGHIIRIHPVAIIAAVLLGGHLYGVVGMMIAVPVLSVLQILLRHMWFYDRYRNMY